MHILVVFYSIFSRGKADHGHVFAQGRVPSGVSVGPGVVSPWELGEAILAGAERWVVVRLGFCPADTRRRLEMHVWGVMETHQGLSVAHLAGTQEQVQGSRRGLVPTGSGDVELFEEQCWNHTRWKHTELDLKTTA